MGETRPRDFSPQELGFTPQRPVPWLNPRLLAGTGVRTLFADLFGAYLDKREMQAVLGENRHDYSAANELWIDYTADVGDGFDATYSIASLIARPTLDVPGPDGSPHVLPRGDLLVLGGDQVYPTASGKAYGDRWKGPYRAALPEKTKDTPDLYALPGNHDWYDGLTAFLRLFAQGDCIGGWQTRQQRSYFALALPHRWWLFAIDTQLDVYIDKPQLRYFTAAAKDLRPDDKVIVCTPRPTWVISHESPDAYDSLDYFVRTIVEPTGARVPIMLSGDAHHYARYTGSGPDGRGRELVTCGGGGAYLVGTAHLPTRIAVPPPATLTRRASTAQGYNLAATFPTPDGSRALGWRIFWRLPTKNPGLLVLLGLMQTLLMFALRTAHGRWLNAPIAVAVGAVVAGTILFATITALDRTRPRHWIAALLHAIPHVALGVVGTAAWIALPVSQLSNPWSIMLAFAIYFPVIAVLDAFIVGAYLIVGSRFQVNVNELYAGLGIEDFKSFLRLHIAPDGSLTIYPIAVDVVATQWRADPDAPDAAPWIIPTRPLSARLVEPPIRRLWRPTMNASAVHAECDEPIKARMRPARVEFVAEMSMNKVIHGAVRRDINRFLDALDAFAEGDRDRAEQIATAWANFDDQLTRHHESEHEIAWPALEAIGISRELIGQMDEEHDRLAKALAATRAAIAALKRSASAADADAAREAVATLQAVAVEHLDHEEAELEPIYLTKRDDPTIKSMNRRFGRVSPPVAGTFFAWVSDGATPEELATIKRDVPGPVLAIIGGVFGRKYRREVASVWR